MPSPVPLGVLHLLALVVAWVGARWYVGWRHGDDAHSRAHRRVGRRAALLSMLAVAGLAMVAGTQALLVEWFRATIPGFGPDVYPTLSALALFLGPVPLTAFAAYRGVHGRRRRDPPRTAGVAGGGLLADARRFTAGYAALVGPALLVVALAPAVPGGWWLVTGVSLLGFLLAAATPLVVPRLVPTRDLTDAERARLALDDPIPVRVLAVRGHRNALAAGILPGLRVVFVTKELLAGLPPAEARAVLTHELGHHRRGHVALRLGVVAAVALPWLGATAAEVPGAFLVGLLLAGPAIVGVFALMRWTERDADRYAAIHADPGALARGLARLGADAPGDGLAALLAPHPPLRDRIERARRSARARTRTDTQPTTAE